MLDKSDFIYIRWLGAYAGQNFEVGESLEYEWTRETPSAYEPLLNNSKFVSKSIVYSSKHVGLLGYTKSIYRSFDYDCMSEYNSDGQLKATRNRHAYRHETKKNHNFGHCEAWHKNSGNRNFKAIIIDIPWFNLPGKTRASVKAFCEKHNLQVFFLQNKEYGIKLTPVVLK